MSSYRGTSGAWDGGPPGAEAEYAGQAPYALPATDPWTGARYSQYGAAPSYDYSAYSAPPYGYQYDSSYYQRSDGVYYGSSDVASYPSQPPLPPGPSYNYTPRPRERTPPVESQGYERQGSYRAGSRSVSPYEKKQRSYSKNRDSSYEEQHHRSMSKTSKRKKYSSSDRSSSHSRSSSQVSTKRDKKRRGTSSDSSVSHRSNTSSRKGNKSHRRGKLTRRDRSSSGSQDGSKRTPSMARSSSKSPRHEIKKNKSKTHSNKDKRHKDEAPPRSRDSTTPPLKVKKSSRSSLTPPRSYKLKDRRSETPKKRRESSSTTPPKKYSRNTSSSKSPSISPPPRRAKRKHSRSRSFSQSRSASSGSSRASNPPHRSRSKSNRKGRKTSRSVSRSNRRSASSDRSPRRRSRDKENRNQSRGKGKRLESPRDSKSRSRSRSHSGTPSDDDKRRGQFTVADRKRFWKLHRGRQEERDKEPRTPPKEVKPPPGAVEATRVDDIEYGDPPDVEGPNFAELLHPPDQVMQASSSKAGSKPMPIPIKNDGSFLEMFKKMQEQTKKAEPEKKPEIKKPVLPFIGKRRGGRVLKTGLVKKAKAIDEQVADNTPKDAWSLYMQEVKKYRDTSCEEERKTRPLVK